MKKNLPLFALIVFLALFLFVPSISADTTFDSPVGPVEDITSDLESLPDYVGLGSLVTLVVVVLKLLKLPDGYGGYAALGVGAFAYVMSLVLPEAPRETLFEALERASQFLLVILGSVATHYTLKYTGVDRLWKGKGAD